MGMVTAAHRGDGEREGRGGGGGGGDSSPWAGTKSPGGVSPKQAEGELETSQKGTR